MWFFRGGSHSNRSPTFHQRGKRRCESGPGGRRTIGRSVCPCGRARECVHCGGHEYGRF